MTGGCSGELCIRRDSDVSASLCVLNCENGGKRFETCGKDAAGDCVWSTKADALQQYEQCVSGCAVDDALSQQDKHVCACRKILAPICCGGRQYSNPCLAECAGVDRPAAQQDGCAMGECARAQEAVKVCACQTVYSPVCCNGKTYTNACNAECDGVKAPAHAQEECVRGECIKQAL